MGTVRVLLPLDTWVLRLLFGLWPMPGMIMIVVPPLSIPPINLHPVPIVYY